MKLYEHAFRQYRVFALKKLDQIQWLTQDYHLVRYEQPYREDRDDYEPSEQELARRRQFLDIQDERTEIPILPLTARYGLPKSAFKMRMRKSKLILLTAKQQVTMKIPVNSQEWYMALQLSVSLILDACVGL